MNALNTSCRGGKIFFPLFSSVARNDYGLYSIPTDTRSFLKYVFFDSASMKSPQYPTTPEWNSSLQDKLLYERNRQQIHTGTTSFLEGMT